MMSNVRHNNRCSSQLYALRLERGGGEICLVGLSELANIRERAYVGLRL